MIKSKLIKEKLQEISPVIEKFKSNKSGPFYSYLTYKYPNVQVFDKMHNCSSEDILIPYANYFIIYLLSPMITREYVKNFRLDIRADMRKTIDENWTIGTKAEQNDKLAEALKLIAKSKENYSHIKEIPQKLVDSINIFKEFIQCTIENYRNSSKKKYPIKSIKDLQNTLQIISKVFMTNIIWINKDSPKTYISEDNKMGEFVALKEDDKLYILYPNEFNKIDEINEKEYNLIKSYMKKLLDDYDKKNDFPKASKIITSSTIAL